MTRIGHRSQISARCCHRGCTANPPSARTRALAALAAARDSDLKTGLMQVKQAILQLSDIWHGEQQ